VLRILCAIVACLAIAATPAAAETTGEVPPYSGSWPSITGPEAPEEYVYRVDLHEQALVQATPTEVLVKSAEGARRSPIRSSKGPDGKAAPGSPRSN
jgi:hypothetical protein